MAPPHRDADPALHAAAPEAEASTGGAFRYSIGRERRRDACRAHTLVGEHFRQMLDLLVPVSGGTDLSVDGYRMLNDPDTVQRICHPGEEKPSSAGPLDIYEPRIGYIRRLLASLLDVVELEFQGRPAPVDGFRLKNVSDWMAAGGGASDILAQAATRCNLNCRFCYNRHTTPALAPRPKDPGDEYQDICERIAHYVPDSGLNLFPDMGGPCEMLAHPRIQDILARLRRKTGECFRIATNGAALHPAMIDALAGVKPVYLDISINSASPSRRRWLMGDPTPDTAIEAPGRLDARKIPYSLVIVPWPFPSAGDMLDDLDNTLAFAQAHHPTMVQISLPGYTRDLLPVDLRFGPDVWISLREFIRDRRRRLRCPVVLRPGLFEEYDAPDRLEEPVLAGVVENSPLCRAGLRQNDRIEKINGIRVKNRRQARSLLSVIHGSDLKATGIRIARNGSAQDVPVNLSDAQHPYCPEAVGHLGAVFASGGIPASWTDQLRRVITHRDAGSVLLMTSRLVRPALARMISASPWFSGIDLHLVVPENRHFGGNIFMGDLLVVEDFIAAARVFIIENGVTPDLVLVPASAFSMSGWGRDLTGRVFLDIERELKIPAALVPCDPLFD